MKSFTTLSLAFAALALFTSAANANPRDAGSKIRGEAYEGTSESIRSTARYYYYTPAPIAQAPAVAVQRQPASPAQPSANATAAVNNSRSGTRTFSVEPQTAAPTMTYRSYSAPRRLRFNDNRADRKVLGHYGY